MRSRARAIGGNRSNKRFGFEDQRTLGGGISSRLVSSRLAQIQIVSFSDPKIAKGKLEISFKPSRGNPGSSLALK